MNALDKTGTITIYKSHSMADACQYVMKSVKNIGQTDLSTGCTVIVPDHMSLEAERALLEVLGGSFNTQVKTFQRLAGDILPKCDNYLSKQAGIMTLSMIIKKIKAAQELACFVKGVDTPGFVENMYDVISMLKYCKIEPKALVKEGIPEGVKVKASDIAKIYQAYLDYTKDRFTDSADNLNNLRDAVQEIGTEKDGKIVKNDVVSNGYFYFYDFDNFTRQELAIIEQLALKSRGVMVACCVGKGKRDSYLYLNDIYQGVKEICARHNGVITCNEIDGAREYPNKYAEAIGNNLYRYDEKKSIAYGDFVEIFEGETRTDEVYALACKIKQYLRTEGKRYRDVYVVTSDVAKYSNAVSIIFKQFGIPFFCDRQFVLSDHPYARFVLDYLTMWKNGKKLQFALPVVKNYLFCGDSDDVFQFENYCLKYNVKYNYDSFGIDKDKAYFQQVDSFRQRFYDLCANNRIDNVATVNDYVAAIKKLIEYADLNERNNQFCKQQIDMGLEYEAKVTAQAQAKFEKVLAQASEIMGDSRLTLDEFCKMLTAGVASVKMSVIPVRNDCVVFANMSKARKHDIKFLALLGANQGAMPIVKSDCKLLSDKNIEDLASAGVNVEPKIYIENKRERFSLFQLLLEPSDKLYVSYAKTDGATSLLPSPFIAEFGKIFVNKKSGEDGKDEEVPLRASDKIDEGLYTKEQTVQKLVQNYRRKQDNRVVTMPFYDFLHGKFKEDVDKYIFKKNADVKVERGAELYLKHSHTSVSQLTTFFECPYKFYFQYGLNIKKRPVAEFQSSDLGTILHAVLEKYVPNIDKDKDEKIIEDDDVTEQKARDCFKKVIEKEYKSLDDEQMRGVLLQLEAESVRMCKVVKQQLRNSEFKNYDTELCFGENSTREEDGSKPSKPHLAPLTVKFNGGEFNLKGVIDRVDVLKSRDKDKPNLFIIVDYKSGKAAAKFSEQYLYLGQKMQLLVYAKAVQEHLKLDSGNGELRPVGFYYFKMHDNFTDLSDDSVYVYNGRTLNDVDVIFKIDTLLHPNSKSEKLGLRVTKEGAIDGKYVGKTLTAEQFDNEMEYAMQLIARAGELMTEGYASITPYENKCDFCDYRSICDFGDVHVHAPRDTKDIKITKEVIDNTVKHE